ncbi:hypothetical protein [Eubacterium sp. MSJ-33]|uniref:hypothetical protein n=1 Tax=Eubacterium sp. MSJ-33 TaxID=2841528 RepID=UPI001C7564EE|nr:hypothetical protein [Eubacterium sp. MSJ-33]QWT52533.1 hypothetical protein KP625_10705 [Eubacterium sp. MSJ-33]
MSLFVCKDNDAGTLFFDKEKRVLCFSSYQNIQDEFCSSLESNVCYQSEEIMFFDFPSVKEFLSDNGIEYKGGYLLECDEWIPKVQFVTHLHFILQMSCILLYSYDSYAAYNHDYDKNYTVVGVLFEPSLFELKYILPVLKKMDIYVVVNCGLSGTDFWLMDAVEAGIEVFVYGVSVSGKNRKELMDYLDKNG